MTTKRPLLRPFVAVVCAAVLGGGVVAAALLATDTVGGSSGPTTVIQQSAPSSIPAASSGSGLSAAALYSRVASGVVDITATQSGSSGGLGPFGNQGQQQSTASGSGFVFDGQGHIMTAAHVVDGSSSITVTLQNGQKRTAKLLGEDKSTDVAVLSIDPSGLTITPLQLGSSQSLVVGDAVATIGDPFGYDRSLSTGVVSGLDRTIQAPDGFTIPHAIQTDAALNPGNSGGPVLDSNGHVIGIADQIATGGNGASGGSEQNTGVGFAVPIDVAKTVMSSLEQGSPAKHAYLGVSSAPATGTQSGALVQGVQSGSPAAKAGVRAGDLVVSFGGKQITGVNDLISAVSSHQPGDTIPVTVTRGGSKVTLQVTLGTQPSQAPTSG